MIVVDASVLAVALAVPDARGRSARVRLVGERLHAPEVIDLEVTSVLRAAVARQRLDAHRAARALADMSALPLARTSHVPLLHRIWELRENVTPYDAAYVALAELIEAPLLTADRRLAGAPGLECEVETLAESP